MCACASCAGCEYLGGGKEKKIKEEGDVVIFFGGGGEGVERIC